MTNERYILKCVFCFDKNYAKYCLVALFSLLINNHDKVKVFLLFTDDVAEIDLDNIQLLKKRFDFDLEFLKISYVNLLNRFKISHHFTQACYLRLLLPELLPAEDKILYLDCDLIVHKSLTNLYATNIECYKYAGVVDVIGQKSSKIDAVYKENYINSGVLLMNLKALRNDNSFEEMNKLYDKYFESITWPDQCLINIYAYNGKLILTDNFNFQVFSDKCEKELWLENLEEKSIYHFVGGTKPWHRISRKHISDFWWTFANELNSNQLQILD